MTNAAVHRQTISPEMSTDDRRARMATTAATVQAAHDGHLHRAMASVRWERRGLFRRLVRS